MGKAKPIKGLTTGVSATGFGIENTNDGFYSHTGGSPRIGNGYGVLPDASKDLGWEYMLWAKWKHASGLSVLFETGYFTAGDYIEESLSSTGGAKDAQRLSITCGYKF